MVVSFGEWLFVEGITLLALAIGIYCGFKTVEAIVTRREEGWKVYAIGCIVCLCIYSFFVFLALSA